MVQVIYDFKLIISVKSSFYFRVHFLAFMTLPVNYSNFYIIRNTFKRRQDTPVVEFNHTHDYRIKSQILTNVSDSESEEEAFCEPCELAPISLSTN